jgi:DNA primase
MRDLISLAAGNADVQRALVERIEELQEPISLLAGGPVLQRLLEKLPIPGSAESWEDFINSLPPEQAAALRKISNDAQELTNAYATVEQACSHAAREAVVARIDIIKARINSGTLSGEDVAKLSMEAIELHRMLNAH